MQNSLADDRESLAVQGTSLLSRGENALNGKPRGSVLEGMSVHFLTLPKLGAREKVHRVAGLRDEERETINLVP